MALAELQSFIEDRLLAYDPTIDISSGSPVQTKLIGPILSYLGTDPFETDIDAFLTDRFAQEFPDIYAADPGAIRDTFVNPLKLILEPWKRETNSIRRGQSLQDPTLLSDNDTDALAANYFSTRDTGGYAVGVGRLYFQNPVDVRIAQAQRAYNSSGLNFFPTSPVTISAETVAFNRDGTLFYVDIPLRSESPGSEYNIAMGDLVGFDGVQNVVKVTNLRQFTGGSARQDATAFVEEVRGALTERSLSSRRGASALILDTFKGAVRSIQAIGARDPEMQRDLLVAAGPGHAWITGRVELYSSIAYVRARVIDGPESDLPAPGDTLYVYLDPNRVQGAASQKSRFLRLRVERLLMSQALRDSNGFQLAYLVQWSDPDGVLPATFGDAISRQAFVDSFPVSLEGGFSKPGVVQVSSIIGGVSTQLGADSGGTHINGCTDIYVRPSSSAVSQTVIDGVSDLGTLGDLAGFQRFYMERMDLITTANRPIVSAGTLNLAAAGVLVEDLLSIESGVDAGLYPICAISENGLNLTLSKTMTLHGADLKFRILRSIRLNPFAPKIVRLPFGDSSPTDLQSMIGSPKVTFTQSNLYNTYGAQVGDTLRILTGLDVGDFTIQSFGPGLAATLDRPLQATESSVAFEVFKAQAPVDRPLVRVKEIALLDSAKQTTGITVPLADPVAVRPLGPFTSAKVVASSQIASGYVLPAISIPYFANPGPGTGRYSGGLETPRGYYTPVQFWNWTSNELDLLYTADTVTAASSYFLMTPEQIIRTSESFPPYEPKPGESLYIKNGPNKGGYLIKSVLKFKYQPTNILTSAYLYFVEIYGVFPVDPVKAITDFVTQHGFDTGLSSFPTPILFPTYFLNWYRNLGHLVAMPLNSAGTQPPSYDEIQGAIDAMMACQYDVGAPAHGVLRSYFKEPTLFEQWTDAATKATQYTVATSSGEPVFYRPEPGRYQAHEIYPASVAPDAGPTTYPRDIVCQSSTATRVSGAAFTTLGVQPHDVLSVHEERPLLADTSFAAIVTTAASSAKVTLPSAIGGLFSPDMVGDLLFLEDGEDEGGYYITEVVDSRSVILDKVLRATTGPILKEGTLFGYGLQTISGAATNIVVSSSGTRPFTTSDIGNYITIYNVYPDRMGSFNITGLVSRGPSNTFLTGAGAVDASGFAEGVTVSMAGNDFYEFPTIVPDYARFAVTAPGAAAPQAVSRYGKPPAFSQDLVGVCSIRVYRGRPTDYPILSLDSTSLQLDGTSTGDSTAQPYRIFRSNIRRVSPTEMAANQEGPFYYFDTEVSSTSPSTLANIPKDSYLMPVEGTFRSVGYRHVVKDPSYSFSTKEEGFLDLPIAILPVGSSDTPDNWVQLLGAPLAVTYEKSDVVAQVQDFITSSSERSLAGNFLARHFLPAYVSYDASYQGGESTSSIADKINSYVDQLSVESPIDVSEIEKIVEQSGGNLDTPTEALALIYDWDRKLWAEFSENQIGGPDLSAPRAPYNGSPRLLYFVPGPNTSETADKPAGERINLTRR